MYGIPNERNLAYSMNWQPVGELVEILVESSDGLSLQNVEIG